MQLTTLHTLHPGRFCAPTNVLRRTRPVAESWCQQPIVIAWQLANDLQDTSTVADAFGTPAAVAERHASGCSLSVHFKPAPGCDAGSVVWSACS